MGAMLPTNQFRWFQKVSLHRFVGGGEASEYTLTLDPRGRPGYYNPPVLQQGWTDHSESGLVWRDVPVVEETVEEAQKRCDALNARREKGAKA